jgi:hypothetical protein
VSVVVSHVAVDLADQIAHAAERVAPYGLVGDEREPAFYLIKPALIGGREMDVEAPMADKPSLDPRMLVSRVVVDDQMDLEIGRNTVVEMVEKSPSCLHRKAG